MTKHTLKRRGINRAFTLKERSSFWPSNQNEIASFNIWFNSFCTVMNEHGIVAMLKHDKVKFVD